MNLYPKITIALLGGALLLTAGCSTYPHHSVDSKDKVEKTSAPAARILGTKWGENINSSVNNVSATRLTQTPHDTVTIHYRGERIPSHVYTQSYIPLLPIEVKVIGENGQPMPIYRDREGQYILPANEGMRYALHITNNDKIKSFEVITTVDGLDVLNGQIGSYQNSGYLIRPGKQLEIEGFRKNSNQVAAFRFAAPEASYVNQNIQGDERNIGVIGVAIFEVREELPDCEANPFPAENDYAPVPCRKR
ncbi:hypothetical protein [Providencia burhodogranariea]|uniref:Lipoprotein n=1 Tax=Providencia burhodogranariea DSM 19968 TaxID=1141662 RepID=K8W0M1_9GAMM|nr:hypothetical protein [Providencia burhodogranariea]EKT54093.1 hypothetical protein OOA_17874 [Providencia burhodogranariea DSM 19968]